jgi:hypothetical protein
MSALAKWRGTAGNPLDPDTDPAPVTLGKP